VIGVEVRDEDLRQLRQADRRAQHLALRPLAAVEEQALPAAPDEQRRGSPLSRRDRARRPEEDEVEVHWRESRRRDQGLRPSIRSRGSRRSSVSTTASCTPASQKTLTDQRRGSRAALLAPMLRPQSRPYLPGTNTAPRERALARQSLLESRRWPPTSAS